MLFNYPSFIGEKEQTPSELLYNNIKILIQTSLSEIWYDVNFGTNLREQIKRGIDNLVIAEIRDELETKLMKYFINDMTIENLNIYQDINKVKVDLDYIELRTGIHYTVQTEEIILNDDQTLY